MPAAAHDVPFPGWPRSSRSTDFVALNSRGMASPVMPAPATMTSFMAPFYLCYASVLMVRALIFDFNGVLADDDPIHMRAFRRVAEEEGLSFTVEEYMEKYLPLND